MYTFTGQAAEPGEVVNAQGLEAGTITVQGPNGTQTLDREAVGVYDKSFLQPTIPGLPGGIPGFPQSASFLTPGNYTFAGTGGSGVGAFTTSRSYSGGVTWTNKAAISTVNHSQGVTVNWTGGNANEEYAYIFGMSIAGLDLSALSEEGKQQEAEDEAYGAAFICQADVSRGSFTVGPEVLSALPPSQTISTPLGDIGLSQLQVGSTSKPRTFNAPMLDLGLFLYQRVSAKVVNYQ